MALTVVEHAKFLLGWSKGKTISRVSEESNFYKCGKWMSLIPADQLAEMLESGMAIGTVRSFTMNKGMLK